MTTKIPVELSSTPGIVDGSNATAITIDSSENVGIGTTSVLSGNKLDVRGGNIMVGGYGGGTDYGLILTPDDGSGYWNVANITGGHLTFNRSATIGSTEKMRIDASGNVDIADGNLVVASGHGIDFSANANESGMTSELLDDYEEGTWTPAFTGATGIAYSSQTGYYVKVGDLVTLMFAMVVSTAPTSGTNIYITMPFNPKGSGSGFAGTRWNYITGGTNSSSIQAVTSLHEYSTTANFYSYNITSGTAYSSYTHYSTGVYSATITYQID